jgi:hypothetical protein
MSRAQTYRQYASLCLSLAQKTDNPHDKAMLLHMAETWRQLSERTERNLDPPGDQNEFE